LGYGNNRMNRGEIWTINFSPQVGDEIRGIRPAIIVNHNNFALLELRLVIPITKDRKFRKPWHIPIEPSLLNNLTKNSIADCFQLRPVSKRNFVAKIGEMSEGDFTKVKLALLKILDLT